MVKISKLILVILIIILILLLGVRIVLKTLSSNKKQKIPTQSVDVPKGYQYLQNPTSKSTPNQIRAKIANKTNDLILHKEKQQSEKEPTNTDTKASHSMISVMFGVIIVLALFGVGNFSFQALLKVPKSVQRTNQHINSAFEDSQYAKYHHGNLWDNISNKPNHDDYLNEDNIINLSQIKQYNPQNQPPQQQISLYPNNIQRTLPSQKTAIGMLREHQGVYQSNNKTITIQGNAITITSPNHHIHEYLHLNNAFLGQHMGVIVQGSMKLTDENDGHQMSTESHNSGLILIFNQNNDGFETDGYLSTNAIIFNRQHTPVEPHGMGRASMYVTNPKRDNVFKKVKYVRVINHPEIEQKGLEPYGLHAQNHSRNNNFNMIL